MPEVIVGYASEFLRQFKKLEPDLQEEVLEKIDYFKNSDKHLLLKVHKLHGPFSGCYSFSVNYKVRIVFTYNVKRHALLLAIGDHDIYK